jgi:response regulator RpfG family c-di-GMP phosphodiesterase
MRMPGMNGVQFLSKVKVLSPESTRIMLTGETGLDTAIDAVNDGNIFQFLAKPCTKDTLQRALLSGLEQFHLVRAEKEVLENTLCGIIALLTEVLSLVSPAAFSRAMQVLRHMFRVVAAVVLANPWRFEIAALLSQLGCVILDPETIDAVYAGRHLPPDTQARYDSHPKVARALLETIPRMQPVAWIIDHQNRPAPVEGDVSDPERAGLRWGAQLLRATLAFDDLLRKGQSRAEAASRIARQHNDLDTRILHALVETEPESET